jgi:alpha/beta superfamily hydrolase
VTVAPPVARFDFSCMVPPAFPWLVIQGDADEVVDPPGVIHWAKSLDPPPQLVVMPGVGHFFHGSLQPLRDVVSGWIRSD